LGELEKDIEGPSIAYARKVGWMVLKLSVRGRRGWPDVLFIGGPPLVVLMIEFKRPKEKPRRLQVWTIEQLRERGMPVYVVDNYGDAKRILDAAWLPKEGHSTGSIASVTRLIAGSWTRKD